MVGAEIVGTIDRPTSLTTGDVGVVSGELAVPQHLAGVQVQSDHRVAGIRGRVRIAVASSDVERVPLHIDGWGRPRRRARRTEQLRADRVLFRRSWLLRNCESLPDARASL